MDSFRPREKSISTLSHRRLSAQVLGLQRREGAAGGAAGHAGPAYGRFDRRSGGPCIFWTRRRLSDCRVRKRGCPGTSSTGATTGCGWFTCIRHTLQATLQINGSYKGISSGTFVWLHANWQATARTEKETHSARKTNVRIVRKRVHVCGCVVGGLFAANKEAQQGLEASSLCAEAQTITPLPSAEEQQPTPDKRNS